MSWPTSIKHQPVPAFGFTIIEQINKQGRSPQNKISDNIKQVLTMSALLNEKMTQDKDYKAYVI